MSWNSVTVPCSNCVRRQRVDFCVAADNSKSVDVESRRLRELKPLLVVETPVGSLNTRRMLDMIKVRMAPAPHPHIQASRTKSKTTLFPRCNDKRFKDLSKILQLIMKILSCSIRAECQRTTNIIFLHTLPSANAPKSTL